MNNFSFPLEVKQCRDLTCIKVPPDNSVVVACDSLGGIGEKSHDAYKTDPKTLGHFALRVPLMEVLASGAIPFLVIDTLSIESGEMSERILRGMQDLLCDVGLLEQVRFNGSTEDNVITVQTGLGVTVLGYVKSDDLKLGISREGQSLVLAGLPKSAPRDAIVVGDKEILDINDLIKLRQHAEVFDIVPVGSHGVRYEVEQLAASSGLPFTLFMAEPWLEYSGGPSTCALLSCHASAVERLASLINAPMLEIGALTVYM